MKVHCTKIISAFCSAALGLGVAASGAAQTRKALPEREAGAARGQPPAADLPSSTSSVSSSVAAIHSENLQRAADDYEERSFKAWKGREIKADDETLGEVHDVIVDAKAGRITHVIASSGGVLGAGDTLRLVPIDRLVLRDQIFSAKLSRQAFDALPRVAENDLKAGRIPGAGAGAALSQFQGRKIRVGDAEAGELTDVVLDFKRGTAFAVVNVNGEFAGTEGNFLVPFERLRIRGSEAEAIDARIDRADFAHVQPEAAGQAGRPAPSNPETQPLSPTGRADPGSDAPRHAGRNFGAAQNDSAVGGAPPNATPTDRDAANTDGRLNLSTAVPRDGRRDPFFPDTGGNARGSVVPGNDGEDEAERDAEAGGETDRESK